jgi:hypothetical protein
MGLHDLLQGLLYFFFFTIPLLYFMAYFIDFSDPFSMDVPGLHNPLGQYSSTAELWFIQSVFAPFVLFATP